MADMAGLNYPGEDVIARMKAAVEAQRPRAKEIGAHGELWVNIFNHAGAPKSFAAHAYTDKERAKKMRELPNRDLVYLATRKIRW